LAASGRRQAFQYRWPNLPAAVPSQCRPLYFCPVFCFFFFSSPNLSGRRLNVYHTSTHGVALAPSANLECRFEMCCTRLAGNTGRKKIAILAPSHNFVGLYLGSVTARQSSSGREPKFAALNRWRHLCSAGPPSRWALAHILVKNML